MSSAWLSAQASSCRVTATAGFVMNLCQGGST